VIKITHTCQISRDSALYEKKRKFLKRKFRENFTMSGQMCGGLGEKKQATAETQKLIDSVSRNV
jgi:hypothetical protein